LNEIFPSRVDTIWTEVSQHKFLGDEDECRPTPGKRQFARVACGAWATLVACHFCDRDVLHQGQLQTRHAMTATPAGARSTRGRNAAGAPATQEENGPGNAGP